MPTLVLGLENWNLTIVIYFTYESNCFHFYACSTSECWIILDTGSDSEYIALPLQALVCGSPGIIPQKYVSKNASSALVSDPTNGAHHSPSLRQCKTPM